MHQMQQIAENIHSYLLSEINQITDISITVMPMQEIRPNWGDIIFPKVLFFTVYSVLSYGDCAGNTVEENSSVFSLIRMR